MPLSSHRWRAITESEFPWEREALDYLKEELPDQEPFRAWSNFEFISDDERIYEVDLLVLTRKGLFFVEIKSRPGELRAAATQMGVIMGTAAYMSPEQAKGKTADRRADIWAFGCVLYEMLTGQRPFVGDDVSDTLAAVLRAEVDLDALPDVTPARLRQVVRRCLQKDPKQRLHDVADLRLAMEGAFETTGTAPAVSIAAPQLRIWQRPVPALIVVLIAAVVTGLGVWSLMLPAPPEPRPLARFVIITPPEGPLRTASPRPDVAVSPDGTRIVYGAGRDVLASAQLYLRALDQLDATPLRGTEAGDYPFFSPDGAWVGFRTIADNTLKKVSVLGGPAVTICELGAPPLGMSWGPDDIIVFATAASNGLMRVPTVGGEPEVLTTVDPEQDETGHFWPEVLPNGKAVLFTAWSGSDETSRIAAVSLETGAITYLVPGGSNPHYAPTGHIVYGVGGTLRAVGFDPDRLELTSNNPVPVVENVNTKTSGAANFSLSGNGSLVYVSGGDAASSGPPRTLVWVDREGREEPLAVESGPYTTPRVSPDGTRVAVDRFDPANWDVWIHDVARRTLSRVTTDSADDNHPLWTLDGERLVFQSNREGARGLFWKAADGTGSTDRLMESESPGFVGPAGWSPDGNSLIFGEVLLGTGFDVGVLSMEGDRQSELLLQTEFAEWAPTVSPDGEWLAYYTDETGQEEVYAQRFPDLGDKRQISVDGGREPLWSPDGRELFYRSSSGLMAVPIDTEPTFRAGTPETVFEQPYALFRGRRNYDISPDGQRFLMIKEGAAGGAPSAPAAQIVVVENWFGELQRLVPVD